MKKKMELHNLKRAAEKLEEYNKANVWLTQLLHAKAGCRSSSAKLVLKARYSSIGDGIDLLELDTDYSLYNMVFDAAIEQARAKVLRIEQEIKEL